MTSRFILSAFGDEISEDVDQQLTVLNQLGIGYLELRSAWGTNVLELDDNQIALLKDRSEAHSTRISCIGSPIGKSPIDQLIDQVVEDLNRILDVAALATVSSGRSRRHYRRLRHRRRFDMARGLPQGSHGR